MTIFWVDDTGVVLVATSDNGKGPPGATPVTVAPEDGRQIWDFAQKKWGPKPPPKPDPKDELVKAAKAANSIAELKIVLIDAIKAFK